MFLGDGVFTELNGVWSPFVDSGETTDEETEGNEEKGIREAILVKASKKVCM